MRKNERIPPNQRYVEILIDAKKNRKTIFNDFADTIEDFEVFTQKVCHLKKRYGIAYFHALTLYDIIMNMNCRFHSSWRKISKDVRDSYSRVFVHFPDSSD